ncbi:MAG TPA: cytochrome c [Candidatus Angelobacter sp.]|nr:cytochrome c [Candidatus Angelobacter sp.]
MNSLRMVLAVIAVCGALSLSRAQEPSAPKAKRRPSVYDEIGQAPEKARAKHNPLEQDPDGVAAGGILFEQHCAECHGDRGEGSRKGPSLRAAQIQKAEPGAIFWILTNGVVRKGMPVWSKLPEPQRWQLVSFIKSLGGPAMPTGPSRPDAQPQGDAAKDSPWRRR